MEIEIDISNSSKFENWVKNFRNQTFEAYISDILPFIASFGRKNRNKSVKHVYKNVVLRTIYLEISSERPHQNHSALNGRPHPYMEKIVIFRQPKRKFQVEN